MNKKTVKKLNMLNAEFYRRQAQSFSDTRSISWPGWDEMQNRLDLKNIHLKQILDVGCGNGRFVQFLKDNQISFEQYLGIDSSSELINIAHEQFEKEQDVTFEIVDVLDHKQLANLPEEQSLIVAFGLIHHVPGYENRLKLIKDLANKLANNGNLVITFWQFRKSKRFDKMILPVEKFEFKDDLEEGDHLLDWDKSGLPRYCHHFSDDEIAKLKEDLEKTETKVVSEYNADGKERNLNTYLVLKNARQQVA